MKMTDIPTHVYDNSRFPSGAPSPDRQEVERVIDLGNGLTQVDIVDAPTPPKA